jgi:O-antigen/teichoic acid export membrane protein
VSLLQQVDRVALAALLPVSQVSFYAVPLRLSQRVSQVVEHIASPFYPTVSAHLTAGRDRDLELQYRQGLRLIAAVAAGAVAVAGGLASPLLQVWMGPDFARAGTGPMRLLLLAYAASALATLPSVASDAAGRPGIPATFLGIGSLLHVGLLLWWIPRFGLLGAAAAVLVGFLIPLIFGVREVHRRVDRLPGLGSLARELTGALLAGTVAGGGALWLAGTGYPGSGVLPLLLSLSGTGLVHLLALFAFGGLRLDDVRRLVNLFRRTAHDAHRG